MSEIQCLKNEQGNIFEWLSCSAARQLTTKPRATEINACIKSGPVFLIVYPEETFSLNKGSLKLTQLGE